jgi:hypothetical protein
MTEQIPKEFDDENGCVTQGLVGRVWKFVIHEDYVFQSDLLVGKSCDFNWMRITPDGTITVKGSHDRGYAWDGCTPKWNFLQITWGNFDGQLIKHKDTNQYQPYTYYASLVHDVIYQYKRCVPLTRKETDRIFLLQLRQAGYKWAPLYYAGVRCLGWIYKGWGKGPQK